MKIIYNEQLPIFARKSAIVRAIRDNTVTIITGETGSGKTTQIPKMCIEAGQGLRRMIGCTQPRRIAAITVARRIAEELKEELGKSVGYKIRFDDRSGRRTRIKIMTDGILLMEAQADPDLRAYDTIIVDEAHERSLNVDFALGILKQLLARRRDLKLIITSATLDLEKFKAAFPGAPVLEVSGRMYPVKVVYRAPNCAEDERASFPEAAAAAVAEIIKSGERGDVLIFMPTELDIRETCDLLEAQKARGESILPLYARLPWSEQRRIFQATESRKIIVSTNIAETSITIPGIRFVIDSGMARISQYSARLRATRLPVVEISRSSADQRKGRCGRVQHGICIRLYPEENYSQRDLFTKPEILRSNLAEVILRMLALNVSDLDSFPFIDPPQSRNVQDGLNLLQELGAVTGNEHAPGYRLTQRGRRMARLPLDPRISRILIEAEREGCLEEMTIIAAALSIQDAREWPPGMEEEARRAHGQFVDRSSDFSGYLKLWKAYGAAGTSGQRRKFCRSNFISSRRMREWTDIENQIRDILEDEGFSRKRRLENERELADAIHRSILSGYLANIAVRKEKNMYAAARGREVMLFPGSALFGRGGEWIMAAEMVETSRPFARVVAGIDPKWIEELGGELCRHTYSDVRWDPKRGEVAAAERVTLYGLVIVPARRVSYGRIEPGEASGIFCRALAAGELGTRLPFIEHNEKIVSEISAMEDRLRSRDLFAGEGALESFYRERLPGVHDIRTLKRLLKGSGDSRLRITREELLKRMPDEDELAAYPEQIAIGGRSFPVVYRFAPGEDDDGITLRVPLGRLAAIGPETADRLVPGMLQEKISALLKGLPKEFRIKLQPLGKTAGLIMREMQEGKGSLLNSLSTLISKRFGVDVPLGAWAPEKLPPHLKLRFEVIGPEGETIRAGRDLEGIQSEIFDHDDSRLLAEARRKWERDGITEWDIEALPESIMLEGGSGDVVYPALVRTDDGVSLRLFRNPYEAEAQHRTGVMKLLSSHLARKLRAAGRELKLSGLPKSWAVYFGGASKVEEFMFERLLRSHFLLNVRTRSEFTRRVEIPEKDLIVSAREIKAGVEPLLGAYHQARSVLSKLRENYGANQKCLAFLDEIRLELERLVPSDVFVAHTRERLPDTERYLRALAIRAERGIVHLEKDSLKSDKLRPFVRELEEMKKNQLNREQERAIDEFALMLEEYRISVFAQEMKTAFPVSPKRLEEKIRQIRREIKK